MKNLASFVNVLNSEDNVEHVQNCGAFDLELRGHRNPGVRGMVDFVASLDAAVQETLERSGV